MASFENKKILITGAGSGIGRETALARGLTLALSRKPVNGCALVKQRPLMGFSLAGRLTGV